MNVRDSRVHNYPPRLNAAPSQELLVIRRNITATGVCSSQLRFGTQDPISPGLGRRRRRSGSPGLGRRSRAPSRGCDRRARQCSRACGQSCDRDRHRHNVLNNVVNARISGGRIGSHSKPPEGCQGRLPRGLMDRCGDAPLIAHVIKRQQNGVARVEEVRVGRSELESVDNHLPPKAVSIDIAQRGAQTANHHHQGRAPDLPRLMLVGQACIRIPFERGDVTVRERVIVAIRI